MARVLPNRWYAPGDRYRCHLLPLLAEKIETQNAAVLAHEKATQDAKKRGAAARVAAEKRATVYKSDADRLGAEIERLRTAKPPANRLESCEALESAVQKVREGLKQ